jgi:predicted SprT family Zn-dependent metalloprotease
MSAQRVADAYAKIANKRLGCTLPIPVPLSFDLCDTDPKTAGMAHHSLRVQINMVLFEDNVSHILNETLPHEVGHLVQFNKFDHKGLHVEGHGAEWKEIMRKLGKDPHKYHNLDVTKAIAHHKKVKAENKKKAKAQKFVTTAEKI